MSRIGKLPVNVPAGVTIDVSGRRFGASGTKGSLEIAIPPRVEVVVEGDKVLVHRSGNDRVSRSMHGLARSLIANVVHGVSTGFSRTLEINGVGYRVEQKKEYLVFSLGYSHPIYFEIPDGVSAKIDRPTLLTLSGVDRQKIGEAAAKIRSFRPPEPYKGKGIKYSDEVVRRKEGKSGGR